MSLQNESHRIKAAQGHRRYVIISIFRDPPEPSSPDIAGDQNFWLQRIAYSSWVAHFPIASVHVWMDTAAGCRAVASLPESRAVRCSVIQDVSEEHGRPFLSSIWTEAAGTYPGCYLVWLNGDIAIGPGLLARLEAAFDAHSGAVAISRRTDFDLPAGWAPPPAAAPAALLREAIANASRAGVLHDPHGVDLFALPAESRVVASFPPFLVGVYRWDNWLVVWALRERIPLIDMTAHGLLLHALVPVNAARHSARRGAVYNYVLCKREIGELYRLGSALNADFFLEPAPGGPGPGVTLHVAPSRNQSVGVALARRMGSAGWLAVMAADARYLGAARRWLCHARQAGVGYHAFLALDEVSRAELTAAGETVVVPGDFDMADDLTLVAAAVAGPAGRAGPRWSRREQARAVRALAVNKIMDMGFSVVVADLDSLWVQDPLVALDGFATVQGQEEPGAAGLSDGFLAVRGSTPGLLFWQKVCECVRRNLKALAAEGVPSDPARLTLRACLNHYLRLFGRKNYYGFTSNAFPPKYFPSTSAFFQELLSARQGVLPFVVHASGKGTEDGPDAAAAAFGAEPDPQAGCPAHPLSPDNSIIALPDDEPRVHVRWPAGAGYPRFRIHVVTMARPLELRRLLESLRASNYEGSSVALVLLVVHPGRGADERRLRRWAESYALCAEFRMGPGVVHMVVNQTFNGGLLSHWIDPWAAQDPGEVLITLEDTAEVIPSWFSYVARVTRRYFAVDPAAGGDASLAGFGLQRQQAIIGQRPGLRFGRATPRAILAKEDVIYRYQLPMTWGGAVWFPHAWSAFRAWLLKIGLDKARGVASLSTPCVPNFITNQWWATDPSRFWSAWIIRFMFEHGYYFLYTNLPQHRCMALREGGQAVAFDEVDSLVLPNLDSIQLYDFHFRRILSPEALRWNSIILSPAGLDRCYSMAESNATSESRDTKSQRQNNRVHRDDDHANEQNNAEKKFIIISVFRDPPTDEESPVRPHVSEAVFWLQIFACTSWLHSFAQDTVGIHVWMDSQDGCRNVTMNPGMKSVRCSLIKHISEEHNLPFIHTIWAEAAAEYPGRYLIWLNSDTLVTSSLLLDRIQAVTFAMPSAVVVANGEEIKYSLLKNVSMSNPSQAAFPSESFGPLDTQRIDVIVLPADASIVGKIPPFLVGTTRWESWLMYRSLIRERLQVVDVSKTGMLLHAPVLFNWSDPAFEGAAIYNDVLCKKEIGELYRISTVTNADFIVTARSGSSVEILPNEEQSIGVDLARRMGSAGWIAVVTVTSDSLPLVYQWLCNAKRSEITYHVFLALDDVSRNALEGVNETIISLSDISFTQEMMPIDLVRVQESRFSRGEHWAIRNLVLDVIIGFGFNLITADLDSLWIQDPIKMLDSISTVQAQESDLGDAANGFLAVRSNSVGRRFWHAVCVCHKSDLLLLDAMMNSAVPIRSSAECVAAVRKEFVRLRVEGFAYRVLPLLQFPTSEAYFSISYSAREGLLPYAVPVYLKNGDTVIGRLENVKTAGLFYVNLGEGLDQCPRHPLSPDYGIANLPKSAANFKTGWPGPSAGKLRFRIQITVSSSRPASVKNLLQSLLASSYSGSQVALVFLVVESANQDPDGRRLKEETLALCKGFRLTPDAMHQVVEIDPSAGPLAQWIYPWAAQDPSEVLVILEDTTEVYPSWFAFVTRISKRYYAAGATGDGDASLAGFALRRQKDIIGRRPGVRPGRAAPHEFLTKADILYRYQLPMTAGGAVWFPHAWSALRAWLLTAGVDPATGLARSATPCVPNLATNQGWARDPRRAWVAWVVRFMFDRGLYFLYPNLPLRQTPVRDGADSAPFDAVDGLVLPEPAAIPLFDLHFRRVPSAEALRWNARVIAPPGLDPCFQRPEESA